MSIPTLLGLPLDTRSHQEILEQIKKYILIGGPMYHIVSLNPENTVIATENETFKKVYETAQTILADGKGIVLAAQMVNGIKLYHTTGADFMEDIVRLASQMSTTVLFIGGGENLAKHIAECYRTKYPQGKYYGIEGFKNIKNPTQEEKKQVFDIVTDTRPRFIIAAFGSPEQELWFWNNRTHFKDTVCMGVGGAFDYKGGLIPRAPLIMRKAGLEWLFRLFVQPWRVHRQKRLITFIKMVFQELRTSRLAESGIQKGPSMRK